MTRSTAAGLLALLGTCWLFDGPVNAEEPTNRPTLAGWAEVDITPPLGIGLGGRGGPETLASQVLDPLCAQVLYLRDGKGTGFVLVSLDLIGLPHDLSDRIRTDIVQQLGVEWNLVVLNCSHTHSGPYMIRSLIAGLGPPPQIETDYFKALEEKIASAVRLAAASLRPVEVERFFGQSQVGINRRAPNAQGINSMIPNDKAPYDDQVWILRLKPARGGPVVVFSYACHPVIVYGYAFSALSADFPGVARNALREALGTKAHIQFVQGFAGNIRPRVVADLEHNRFRASRREDVRRAGNDLAEAVLAGLRKPGERLALDFAGAADRPYLARDKAPPRQVYEKMRATALAKTNQFHLAVSDYWLKRYDSGQGFARGDPWALGLIRLAPNQWVVLSGGEPCIEWRAKMSEWLAPRRIVTWGYSQEARAYLPTEALLPEAGYEVLDSNYARANTPAPFAPGIERAVRQSLQRQLAAIERERD